MGRRISDADLLEELIRLQSEHGTVSKNIMDTCGAHSSTTYQRRFGSWTSAIRAAGLKPANGGEPSDDELLSEIRRLNGKFGKVTAKIMREHGEWSPSVYQRRFSSWTKSLEAAGVNSDNKTKYSEEELLKELRRLDRDLGRAPHADEMTELSNFGKNTYTYRFGSWRNALAAAGLEPDVGGNRVSDEELLNEIHRLADIVGGTPSAKEMDELGEYGTTTYDSRFGGWTAAVVAAGLIPNEQRISTSELLNELNRLHDELGNVPRREDMNTYGKYSEGPYYDRFGNWTNALESAGIEPKFHREFDEDDLIKDIQDVADQLGRPPLRKEMGEYGKFSISTFARYFDSWSDAIRTAGYEPILERDIPEKDLLASLRAFTSSLGRPPTREEMDAEGPYSGSTYVRTFGGWSNALRAIGETPNRHLDPKRSELLAELHRLNEDYEFVTTTVMTQYGKYGANTYIRRFGSWNDALRAADITPHHEHNIPESTLIDAMVSLADRLGRSPTANEMNQFGLYSEAVYFKAFGSWNNALRASGFSVNNYVNIPKNALIEELQRVAELVDGSPRKFDMDLRGKYHSSTYVNRFGSWASAVREIGYEPSVERDIPTDSLLADLESVISTLGRPPTKEEFDLHGTYSVRPFYRAFGSFNSAIRELGYEPLHPQSSPGEGCSDYYYGPSWNTQRRARIELDGYQCRNCSINRSMHIEDYGRDLHVHHIRKFLSYDDSKEANRLGNLITLCEDCHPQLEGYSPSFFAELAPDGTISLDNDESLISTENRTLDEFS